MLWFLVGVSIKSQPSRPGHVLEISGPSTSPGLLGSNYLGVVGFLRFHIRSIHIAAKLIGLESQHLIQNPQDLRSQIFLESFLVIFSLRIFHHESLIISEGPPPDAATLPSS